MQVPNEWKEVLLKLKKQESGTLGLHRNPTEADITTAYGIYRYANPNAEIFKYIDQVAKSIGINSNSKTWLDRNTLTKIQSNIDPEKELYYTYLFIKSYFTINKQEINLDQFEPITRYAIISLGWNSIKLCVKCLQSTINEMYMNGYIPNVDKSTKIACDGVYGPNTKRHLDGIMSYINTNKDKALELHFYYRFLNNAKTYYVSLALNNQSKFLMYLKGWNARVDQLIP